jgi:hypothetical protein
MMPDHFLDHEPQELLRKLWVQLRFHRQLAQPCDLALLARRIARWQAVFRLKGADRLGDAEAFGEDVDQRGVDVVDRGAEVVESGVGHDRLASMTFCALPLPPLHLRKDCNAR